ncbi:MAG: hypothetical protein WA820_14415 [Bradyrhizobium sp.]|jgi:hypothetical protein
MFEKAPFAAGVGRQQGNVSAYAKFPRTSALLSRDGLVDDIAADQRLAAADNAKWWVVKRQAGNRSEVFGIRSVEA